MADRDYDLTYSDLNPQVFYAVKNTRTQDGVFHTHDYTEIFVILSGVQKFVVAGEQIEAKAGDVIVCNAGEIHVDVVTNRQDPAVQFVIGFTDFHFRDMPQNVFLFPNQNSHVLHTDGVNRQMIFSICFDMVAEGSSEMAGRYFMLKAYLMQLLTWILRTTSEKEVEQKTYPFENFHKSYAVKRIRKYLEEHYAEKISLDRIAKNMYLSSVYISKIFKEETGETPINYLIKIRLEKACTLLETAPGESIKEIALAVGYNDVYHFSKLFKKYYKVSPLAYKKGGAVRSE
ncbi:MAG: helix-turn-helix transcriptional regulator [Lachnospiraceae bacterium]|nr:helix-turn-helix transcriptional regulator [Lachnospiraceae bacterium]